ncbi:hypothetical protein L3V79_03745 [Thiotrichales bacterium 19S9-12]|nr:hypothetical protein [Thiotrichales bacterium 19S9-11]MCF6811469.1 hypothetical protein [Thiotrichales bacterium 19S9-12]
MSRAYDHIRIEALWNEEADDSLSNDQFYRLLMEQYKIYVEMADRATFRRTLVNLFFMMVNISVVSIMALGLSRATSGVSMFLMLIPLLGLLAICYAWWRLVRFYRHSVTIKEKIIGELEKRMPSTVWQAERKAVVLKGALNPLHRLESVMPYVFCLLYVGIYVYLWIYPPWLY